MHFGMAGWFHIRNMETAYYKPNASKNSSEWPPKYWKFALETAGEPKVEAAFVDFRRFARIRLIDCPADQIRTVSPLVENGPDPVVDKDILTEEWLAQKLASKHVPVKALLLDQANISGIGNWVGDEIMYNARIHPEQYSDTLSPAQVAQLHKSIHYICGFAVDNLADSHKFPEEWLFKHRWGKGRKDSATTLPNGAKFVFLTVGGRTSCVVPSVQKKTGPVAGDVNGTSDKPGKAGKGKQQAATKKDEENVKDEPDSDDEPTTSPKTSKRSGTKRKSEPDTEAQEKKPRKSAKKAETNGVKSHNEESSKTQANTGRRRSARVSGKSV